MKSKACAIFVLLVAATAPQASAAKAAVIKGNGYVCHQDSYWAYKLAITKIGMGGGDLSLQACFDYCNATAG